MGVGASGRFVRLQNVEERLVGDELFLVVPDDGQIHHLNSVGAGIWRLLGEPKSSAEIEQLLAAAYPDVAADRIRGDIADLIEELLDLGLVTPAQ